MAIEIISTYDGERLTELSRKEESLTDDYLSNTDNLQTEFIFNQFFDGENAGNKKKLQLLNISYSLPYLIADTFADYTGEPQTALDVNIERQIMSYSWGGMGIFNCQLIDGQFSVAYHSPAGYIKYPNGDEALLNYYEAKDGVAGKKSYYILITTYFNKLGYLENRLYKRTSLMNIKSNAYHGEEVALDTLDYTKDLEPRQRTFLNRSPIVVIHNKKIRDDRYGCSDLEQVRSLISSIEVSKVNIQDQLLKHLRAKLAVPVSNLPVDENGVADVRKLEAIGLEAGDVIPQYVFNQNPLIERAFQDIEDNLRQIGAILKVPVEFFNLKATGGVESAEAKGIRMSGFLKKIKKIRDKFVSAHDDILEIAKQWNVKVNEEQVVWEDVFPITKAEQVKELKQAKEANFISTKNSIMRYQEIDEAEADKELKEILEEKLMIQKILEPQKFSPKPIPEPVNNNKPNAQGNKKGKSVQTAATN